MVINYAHRGASTYYPENTLSSSYAGVHMGATGIETDVHKTADGVLVLFHDDTLDRVTDGKGDISDYTYEELLRFTVSYGEYDVGELAGQYFVDCAAKYGPDFQINRAQSNFYPYGGENHDMVAKRAQEFLDMLAADPADNVVAFSHAGLIRIALELVVGTRLKNVRCNNCSVAIFAYENGEWYLEGWGIQG